MPKSIAKLTTVCAVITLLAAACGGASGAPSASPTAAQAVTPVTLNVGVVGVIDVAPLFLGVQKGFFAKQKITLNPRVLQTGATVVAGVLSGDLQLGFSNITSIVIAASNRFPLRIVAPGNQAAGGDYSAVYVRNDSPITSAKDLVGKKVAVNGLKNIGSLCVNAALQASHVDYNGIQYVEVPFPQMGAALAQGTVDAVWTVEPWSTVVKAGGTNRVVLRPFTLIAKYFPIASYFTTIQYAQANSGVVSRFKTAIDDSLKYAQNHPTEARAILATYIRLAPGLSDQVLLPYWKTDLEAPLIQKTADLALQFGFTTRKPDMKQLLGT
jgi:NitT/TauT family transport system substrate-binding protein